MFYGFRLPTFTSDVISGPLILTHLILLVAFFGLIVVIYSSIPPKNTCSPFPPGHGRHMKQVQPSSLSHSPGSASRFYTHWATRHIPFWAVLSPQPNWSEHTQEENKKRTRSSRFLDRQSNTDHQSGIVKNVYTAQNKMRQDIQTPEIQKRWSVEIPSRFFHPQACHNFWYWHGWGLARPGYGWKWATPPSSATGYCRKNLVFKCF